MDVFDKISIDQSFKTAWDHVDQETLKAIEAQKEAAVPNDEGKPKQDQESWMSITTKNHISWDQCSAIQGEVTPPKAFSIGSITSQNWIYTLKQHIQIQVFNFNFNQDKQIKIIHCSQFV